MNTEQINSLLVHFNNLSGKKHHVEVCASDMLPTTFNPPAAFVVNTDDSTLPGTHWVAIYVSKNGKTYQYFDSYGLPPLIENHFDFLKDRNIKFNQKRLQSDTTKVCGQYCLAFLNARMNGVTMKSFLSSFSKNTKKNDTKIKKHIGKMLKCTRKSMRKRCNLKQCCQPRVH